MPRKCPYYFYKEKAMSKKADKEHARFVKMFKNMLHPDNVGQSEYRLVHDYVKELIEENNFDQAGVICSLEELREQVNNFIDTFRK
jgi:hypothetical protein